MNTTLMNRMKSKSLWCSSSISTITSLLPSTSIVLHTNNTYTHISTSTSTSTFLHLSKLSNIQSTPFSTATRTRADDEDIYKDDDDNNNTDLFTKPSKSNLRASRKYNFPKIRDCCKLDENDQLVWTNSEPGVPIEDVDDSMSIIDPYARTPASTNNNEETSTVSERRLFHIHVPKLMTRYTIRVTHGHYLHITAACAAVEDEALKLGIPLKSIAYLPTRFQKWTVLRSAHVDKYAREQYELRRHKRVLTIEPKTMKDEYKILTLAQRAVGVVHHRLTMTKHIPANTKIVTLTFQKPRFTVPLEYE